MNDICRGNETIQLPVILHNQLCRHYMQSVGSLRDTTSVSFVISISCFVSMSLYACLLGVRVGEASNPGPLSVAVINPAALYGKTSEVVSLPANLVLCSETSVTLASKKVLESEFHKCGWKTFWSKMVGDKILTHDGRPSFRGEPIGTAIATKLISRHSRSDIPSLLWETCRISSAVVRVDNFEFLILSIYGFPSNNKSKEFAKSNDLLVAAAFKIAVNSGLPFLIGGDFNSQPQCLPIYDEIRRFGAIDAFALSEARFGVSLDPTCRGATFNDSLICHPFLAQRVKHMQVLQEHAFEPHRPLLVEFDFNIEIPHSLSWKIPKSWVILEPKVENIEHFYHDIKKRKAIRFQTCTSPKDGTLALEQWSGLVEDSVDRALAFQHRTDPVRYPYANLPSSFRGRCTQRELKENIPAKAPKGDRHKHYDPKYEIFSITNRHKVRQVRRLRSLIVALKAAHTSYLNQPFPEKIVQQHQSEWFAVLRARGYGSSWQKWILAFEPVTYLSQQIPYIEYLMILSKITEIDCDASCALEHKRRDEGFKKRIQLDDTEDFGSLTYSIIRDKSTPKLNEVPFQIASEATIHKLVKGKSCQISLDNIVNFRINQPATFGSAQVWINDQKGKFVYCNVMQGILPTRGTLTQQRIAVTPDELSTEFSKFWAPKWQRDPVESQFCDEHWGAFLNDLSQVSFPDITPISIRLDDIDLWMDVIKTLPSKKAEGWCGWRYEEIQSLPRAAIVDLTKIIQSLWEHGFHEDMMQSRVTLLAKTLEPKTINDGRPITILSVIYRLVSKVIFVQVSKHWQRILPVQISGGLPGRGVKDLALDQGLVIEKFVLQKLPLCGSSIDLIKAFNLIPRYPLALLFFRLGLDWKTITFWLKNLSRMSRVLISNGCIGNKIWSSTGVPEGCSWSVLGMLAMSAFFFFTLATPKLWPYAYADNWAWLSDESRENYCAWQKILRLTQSLHLLIDFAKSWVWGTTKNIRSELSQLQDLFPNSECALQVKDAVKDLGEILVYQKGLFVKPIADKIQEALGRLQRISWIPLSLSSKCQKIRASVWTLALYSAQHHHIGKDHFCKLRTGAARALGGNKTHSSPWLACAIVSKYLLDPELYVILESIRSFRRLTCINKSKALEAFCMAIDNPTHSPYGPATSFCKYLSRINLVLQRDGKLIHHDGTIIDLLNESFNDISRKVKRFWNDIVYENIQHRRGLGDLSLDFTLTQQVYEKLPNPDRKIILMNMIGGFQTNVIQAKWNATVSKNCPLCDGIDDQKHRFLHCPAIEHIRHKHRDAIDVLTDQRPQWIYHPIAQLSEKQILLRRFLEAIPDGTHSCEVSCTTSHLRFYTDGACHNPTDEHIRVAGWAVVCDSSPNVTSREEAFAWFTPDEYRNPFLTCIATGLVSGSQSAARGELSAFVTACKTAVANTDCLSAEIYTDAQYILNLIALIETDSLTSKMQHIANPDLACELDRLWKQKSFVVHKIKSHRDFSSANSPIDLWNIVGNSLVDKAAGASLQRIPREMQHLIQEVKQFRKQEQHFLEIVLRYIVDMNRCRTELIRKVPTKNVCDQLPDHPLKLAMGDEAREAMSTYMPNNPVKLVTGVLDENLCKCFLMGSHLAHKMWIWLSMLDWPPEESWNTPPASWGISFLELMINFSQCSGMAIPLTLEGKGSTKTYVPYFSQEASMLPHTKRAGSHQSLALRKAIQTIQTLTKTKVFPVDTKKGCFSMRRLHFKGDALGLAVRPSIPKADLTMRLVDKYVTALKGARGLNLPLPDIVEVPIISDPSYAELDTQSRYRAYWRFQNRDE